MADITYHVVVPFCRDDEGNVVTGEAKEAPNGETARRRAQALASAPGNVGGIAFSRTGDPSSGDFGEAVIVATFGEVELGALVG